MKLIETFLPIDGKEYNKLAQASNKDLKLLFEFKEEPKAFQESVSTIRDKFSLPHGGIKKYKGAITDPGKIKGIGVTMDDKKCKFIKPGGDKCNAYAMKASEYCFTHNPEK